MDDEKQTDKNLTQETDAQAGEFEKLKAECAQYLAGWKRSQADYQNLKKDTERERTDFIKYANRNLIERLLPALDQFDLALTHIPDLDGLSEDERKRWEGWLSGMRAVKTHWDQVAASIGLERISPAEVFDPKEHEAVGEEEARDKEHGTIHSIVQNGWKLHGKVLRPAKVILTKSINH